MRAKILGWKQESTKDGPAYLVFLRDENGRSYRSWVMLHFRNFRNWQKFLQDSFDKNTLLDGLIIRRDKPTEIDADSVPRIIEPPESIPGGIGGAGGKGDCLNGNPISSLTTPPLFSNWDYGRRKLHEAMKWA